MNLDKFKILYILRCFEFPIQEEMAHQLLVSVSGDSIFISN